jgi:hypothetical protein
MPIPLDATHTPHITLIQRFVRTADLDKVYATPWHRDRQQFASTS